MTFGVAAGEQFVPRLFAELGVPIRSVSVSRPTLDDVFLSHTGSTIRDAEDRRRRPTALPRASDREATERCQRLLREASGRGRARTPTK